MEEAYNRVYQDDHASFTFTTKRSRDAFIRRCDKYDAEYHVTNYEINGEWDTCVIDVSCDDLRPLRYLISTAS